MGDAGRKCGWKRKKELDKRKDEAEEMSIQRPFHLYGHDNDDDYGDEDADETPTTIQASRVFWPGNRITM